mmetsp:Transcript_72384/g.203211  ORF Transcript_72384/g.203211 Transcript_72384/m.203211 type:complete len:243 (+) Transcript_72384:424-1152(+)
MHEDTTWQNPVEEAVEVQLLDEKFETCIKNIARNKVYHMLCHDRWQCVKEGFNIDDAYACEAPANRHWFFIFYGMVFFCSLLVLDVFVQACRKKVPCMRISGGDYLAFCFLQKRTYLYRYISGFFLVMAGFTICGLLALAASSGHLGWAVQYGLAPVLVVALSMRSFTLPYKAMFDYTGSDFKKIAFKRKFLETSDGFGKRWSTALVQSQRNKAAHLLKNILRDTPTDVDLKKFRSICKFAP